MEQNLIFQTNVISPSTGRVLEVMINEGALISPGMTIISLEPTGQWVKNIQAVLYVSSAGRNLEPGMEALISPATIKKEEYGFIRGRVTSVSEYPASFQGMMKKLGNENLVQTLIQTGPVIEVNIDLVSSSKTISGFKWTSKEGPPFQIQTGTVCIGTIIERTQRPISLVIPMLRKITGIY
jgi:HlyD family secretion protein